jgi:hypothetical protein
MALVYPIIEATSSNIVLINVSASVFVIASFPTTLKIGGVV